MAHKYCFALLFLLTVCLSIHVFAQTNPGKTNNLTIGYGLIPTELRDRDFYYTVESTIKKTSGPFYVKYEHTFFGNLGLGLNVALAEAKNTSDFPTYYYTTGNATETISEEITSYSILFRMNYHFGNIEKEKRFDPYVGTGAGYRDEHYKISSGFGYSSYLVYPLSENIHRFGFEFTAGFRYFFFPSFGTYFEAGFGKSVFQFGGTFSF